MEKGVNAISKWPNISSQIGLTNILVFHVQSLQKICFVIEFKPPCCFPAECVCQASLTVLYYMTEGD